MNDRFLFRAWNKDRMVYFGEGSISFVSLDEDTTQAGLFFPMKTEKFSMSGFEPMQCTGIKDKNGKLIFEGDVVKGMGEIIGVVTWIDEDGRFLGIIPKSFKATRELAANIMYIGQEPSVEIIGNIYENPELLKGADYGS